MSKIDCFIIGHNDTKFSTHVSNAKDLGEDSCLFREINLNYLQYDNEYYHASGIFNKLVSNSEIKPIYDEEENFSLTVASIGSYLAHKDLSFDYANSFQLHKDYIRKILTENDVLSIVITTTYYYSYVPIKEIIDFVRNYDQQVKIILGGPYILTRYNSEEKEDLFNIFDFITADYYVVDFQGEDVLTELIIALKNNMPVTSIDNIIYKEGNSYNVNEIKRREGVFNSYPVKWDLFKDRIDEYVNARTSISCPFSCKFCGFPERAGPYKYAPVNSLKKEIVALQDIESLKCVHFIDDTLNIPPKRFKEFLRTLIKNKSKFQWHSFFRCQFADRETVELMKESNCVGVYLGIESGSDSILENMNKNVTTEQYLKGIELLKEYNILMQGSFIFGYPGETIDTVNETVKFIENSHIEFYIIKLWYFDPLAPIFKEREKYKITGKYYNWEHATMNSHEASELIYEKMKTIQNAIRIPSYNFDFHNIFHLLNRGLTLDQVRTFLTGFHHGIVEKIINPLKNEISPAVLNQMLDALKPFSNNFIDKRDNNLRDFSEQMINYKLNIEFDL